MPGQSGRRQADQRDVGRAAGAEADLARISSGEDGRLGVDDFDPAGGSSRIDFLQADKIDNHWIRAAEERLLLTTPTRIKVWATEHLVAFERKDGEHVALGELRDGADFDRCLGRIERVVEEALGVRHVAEGG